MTEWVHCFWGEVKGESSKRAEMRPGDDVNTAGNHSCISEEFCFVLLVASDCAAELRSRICHLPQWQEVDSRYFK